MGASGSVCRSVQGLCTVATHGLRLRCFLFRRGEARGERHGSPEDKGLYQTTQLLFSCSKSVSRTSPSRFQRRGWSLNAMEQNSFFDNDIKGDGCFCVWSGACLKCSEDSGVVGQVHCCRALGMIISCYRRESLKQLSAWHVNNDLPFLTCWRLSNSDT